MSTPLSPLLKRLAPFLDHVIVAGGFAVNHYGYSRNTLDLDLVCDSQDATVLRDILRDAGYIDQMTGPVAVHCRHPESGFRVDLLLVDTETFSQLRAAAVTASLGDAHPVRILSLSHLIAMKLHALSQQPQRRRDKDLTDIAWLAVINDLSPEQDLSPLCYRYANDSVLAELSQLIRRLRE